MLCTQCRKENAADQAYCGICGTPLVERPPARSTASTPPPPPSRGQATPRTGREVLKKKVNVSGVTKGGREKNAARLRIVNEKKGWSCAPFEDGGMGSSFLYFEKPKPASTRTQSWVGVLVGVSIGVGTWAALSTSFPGPFTVINALVVASACLLIVSSKHREKVFKTAIKKDALGVLGVAVIFGVLGGYMSLGAKRHPEHDGSKVAQAGNRSTDACPLNLPASFAPIYQMASEQRVDYATTPRLVVQIFVPPNQSREHLTDTIKRVMCSVYSSKRAAGLRLGAIAIFAFKQGTDAQQGMFDAGRGDFAPFGDWSKADANVPLAQWRANVSLAESYFSETKTIAIGSRVTLSNDPTNVSDDPKNWGDEHQIGEIRKGAKATVTDVRSEEVGAPSKAVRYKVRLKRRGRTIEGWVHESAVREME